MYKNINWHCQLDRSFQQLLWAPYENDDFKSFFVYSNRMIAGSAKIIATKLSSSWCIAALLYVMK